MFEFVDYDIRVPVYERTHYSRDVTIYTKKVSFYKRNNFWTNTAQQIGV